MDINKESKCICGRPQDPPHCIKCGGVKIYGYSKKKVTHIIDNRTGITKDFRVFRCERCAIIFDEWQLINECKAPLQLSTNEKQEKELKELTDLILHGSRTLTTHEQRRFKYLFKMECWEYRRLVKAAESTNKTIEEVREEEKQAKVIEKTKEQPKSTGIRRIGGGRKFKFTSGAMPPANMNPHSTSKETLLQTKDIKDIDNDKRHSDTVIDDNNNFMSKPRNKVIFEGKLTDEDLRNIPGVMEVMDE